MASGYFRCDHCGRTLPKRWGDEEAAAEARAAFTPDELDDPAVVCDTCWQEMRAVMPDLDARYG